MTDDETNDTTTDRTDASTASGANPAADSETDPAYERGPATVADDDALGVEEGRSPTKYLYWGAFGVLLLLALIAVVRFYLSASQAISIWITPDYEPIFQSAFNLAVLFACAVGLSVLVRRMRD